MKANLITLLVVAIAIISILPSCETVNDRVLQPIGLQGELGYYVKTEPLAPGARFGSFISRRDPSPPVVAVKTRVTEEWERGHYRKLTSWQPGARWGEVR